MTDKDIRKAIREKFKNSREFAVIEEVCATTGFDNNYNTPRRIDMLVINCFKCNGFYIEGIEIKISKSDLKRELNNPEKHEVFFENIDYYTLAIPREMLDEVKDMIPYNWGILVIDENGKARYKRKPSVISYHSGYYHKVINRGFFASVIRGVLRQQIGYQERTSEDYGWQEFEGDTEHDEENDCWIPEIREMGERNETYRGGKNE